MNITTFLARLENVTKAGNDWRARCPAHEDHRPSLSISAARNGGIVIHCHAQCPPEAVVSSLGLTMKDLAPETQRLIRRRPEIVATYPYHDEKGTPLFEVVRYSPKDFRQRCPDSTSSDGWKWSTKTVRRVPFRLPELIAGVKAGNPVYVCEGEKDCLALVKVGFVATCNPGGAGKWLKTFNEYFKDGNAVIIADRDEPGRLHAQQVASALHGVAASVRVVELADIHGRAVKDAADYLGAGGTPQGIQEIVDSAPLWSPTPALVEMVIRPRIEMPGDDRTISSFAQEVAETLQRAELFNRGGVAMRLNWQRDGLEAMTADSFRTWCERYIVCVRTRKEKESVRTMSKEDAGAVLAAQQFLDALPPVVQINSIRLPVMRSNGAIELLPAGYDRESRIYTLDSCPYVEDMPIEKAKAIVLDLFSEFQFFGNDGRSKAVAIAALMGLYAGGILPSGALRPIFMSLANDAGAGKTTLWRLVLLIVCGSATLTTRPKDEDEVRKALLSVVMQAAPYLFFDNLKGHLSSSALEAFVTTDTWRDRVLGGSRMFSGENKATVFITGNGLTISSDIARRSLIAELFQEYERPQDRPFRRILDSATIGKLRPDALAACWSIVRAWDFAGRSKGSRSNASFPAWTEVIGGIVEHAGFGCCVIPHAASMGGDSDAEDIRQLVARLATQGGWHRFTDVLNLAKEAGWFGLEEGDLAEAEAKQGARRRVGHILKRNTGKLFNLTSGASRLESRKVGHSTEYRVVPDSGKIGHNGHIGTVTWVPEVLQPPTPPTISVTDVSDVTDITQPKENLAFALGDQSARPFAWPD